MHDALSILIALVSGLVVFRLVFRTVPRTAHIVDGDTLKVNGVKWRITGYDSPEWDQPGGSGASAFLKTVIRNERCLAYVRGADHYGRPLATVLTMRGPLSWRMAFAGHAHGEGFVPVTLTLVARVLRRGLWSIPGRKLPPSWWREGCR